MYFLEWERLRGRPVVYFLEWERLRKRPVVYFLEWELLGGAKQSWGQSWGQSCFGDTVSIPYSIFLARAVPSELYLIEDSDTP